MNRTLATRLVVMVALGGLLWLLSEIGWDKIASHLRMLGWTGALALLAAGEIEAMLDALALQRAVPGHISFWRILFLNQTGAALNSIVPAGAGEVLKASLLAEAAPDEAVSAIIVWNVAFRLAKALIVIIAAGVACLTLPALRHQAILVLLLGIFSLMMYFIMKTTIRRGWIGRVVTLLARIPIISGERVNRLANQARESEQRVKDFWHHHPRRYLSILALQIAARATDLTAVWMALQLLGSGYSLALCTLIYAGIQLLSYALHFLPTRVGTTEGSAYLLFSYLGLDGGFGVIFQIVMRIKQVAVNSAWLIGTISSRHRKQPQPVSIDLRPEEVTET